MFTTMTKIPVAHHFIATLPDTATYDVVVLGAGAAGMAAAIFAKLAGCQRVLLLESTEYVGGTSALSGGTTWVPLTRFLKDTETQDSAETVRGFLDAAVGERSPRAMREAFIKHGAEAIHTLVDQTEVKFKACAFHPDYLAELPGSTVNGRALEPLPYQAGHLGQNLRLLRPPMPEFTVLGGMMVNRADINQLLSRYQSPQAFLYSAKLVLGYWRDKLLHGQAARSVMGHALIARLLSSLLKLGVDLAVNTDVEQLATDDQGVTRLTVKQGTQQRTLVATGGVILASGGFGRDPDKRQHLFPANTSPYSPAAPGHRGRLHGQVMALGAYYGEAEDQPAFWAPVSIRTRKDGSTAVYPHFVFDRSKPGTVCVAQNGKRFVNESRSYHEFGKAMLAGGTNTQTVWIITDAVAIQKYGLGMVRLGGDDVRPYLADGYLVAGNTLDELAGKLGIPADNLKASVAQMNAAAATGEDSLFQRGSTVYERVNGDPKHPGKNPTLGVISTAPFYAVKLYAGDIGTSKGLMGNENAELVRRDGSVITGLYACGNDLNSMMGGTYPAPGITLGPGIVFAYLAARHASGRVKQD